jgi:predicted transglutaminase-like cysteine proteinase
LSRTSFLALTGALLLSFAAFPGEVSALEGKPARGSHVPAGAGALAPFPYIQFCLANAQDCATADGAAVIDWTPANRALLSNTNLAVNRRIQPKRDAVDTWRADVAQGDCNDYALTKRRALLQKGLPPGALRMAVGTTAQGEWHAVLVVATTAGDMVLDNRFGQLKRWNETDLHWSKIASAEDPRVWRAVAR